MSKEKVYLSPTDNNPLLKVENAAGETVYRDQSTGHEYDQAWIDENGKTRDEVFPPEAKADKAEKSEKTDEELAAEKEAKEAKAKAKAAKKAEADAAKGAGASGASGASGPAV